jgi:hypothetical protein
MRGFLIMIVCCCIVSCESSRARREAYLIETADYIEGKPSLNATAKAMIQQGYLFKGMTQEQVVAAWGSACWSCTGTTDNDGGETWEYPTQILYFDNEGLLIRWSER